MSIEEIYSNHPEICPVPMPVGLGDGWIVEIQGQPTSVKVHMDTDAFCQEQPAIQR